MKKTFKKVLSVFLVLVMLGGLVPAADYAGLDVSSFFAAMVAKAVGASGTCGTNSTHDNVVWELSESGDLVISGDGTMNSYGSGGAPWYSYRDAIVSVTVSSGVTNIGDYAFYGLDKLTSATVADTVTTIGNYAFRICSSLSKIVIPNNVATVGKGAFLSCTALANVTIGSSVKTIGESAFSGCTSLAKIVISDSVITIGANAFQNCSSLASVTLSNNISMINQGTFSGCSSLAKITLPESITTIGASAFSGCSGLAKIVVPDNVATIGDYAFSNCTGLASVTLGEGLSKIGAYAFQYCSSLSKIVIPDGVTSIGEYAFYQCTTLASATLGADTTKIGDYAFYGCSTLASVNIGESMTSIGQNAFRNCISLTTLTLPDSVTTIGMHSFRGCTALAKVTIGDGLTKIPDQAFYGCSALKTLSIGNSVTSIGAGAFHGCSALVKAAIPDSVTNISNNAFYNCSGMTSLTIGSNVTNIGTYAFYNCAALVDVVIPDSTTAIGDYAFQNCSSLTNIKFGSELAKIGIGSFQNCSSLKSISIPASLTSIGNNAFYGCTLLQSYNVDADNIAYASDASGVLFNKEMTTLLNYPIGNTRKEYTLPATVTAINDRSFYGAEYLTDVIAISGNLASVGQYAFYNCASLTDIYFSKALSSVGDYAFSNTSNLSTVHYEGTEEEWNSVSVTASKNTYLTRATKCYECACLDDFYTATFYVDGSVYEEYKLAYGESINTPEPPVKEGCVFVEWTPAIPATMPESNLSFNAVFEELTEETGEYTVSVLVMNFDGITYTTESTETYTAEIGNTVSITPEAREGFTVDTEASNLSDVVVADYITDLCVVYSRNVYDFTTDVDGAATTVKYYYEAPVAEPETPVKDGYTFVGWAPEVPAVMPAADVTVTALWEKDSDPVDPDCGHTSTTTVTIPATCKVAGMEYVVCSICGTTVGEPVVLPVIPHSPVTIVTVSATCTSEGKEHDECSICGDRIGAERTVDPLPHTEGEWETIKEPTCSSEGKRIKKCTVCKTEIAYEAIATLPHTPGEWETVTEPTADTEGKKVIICTVCKKVLQEEIIAKNELVKDEESGIELEFPDGSQGDNVDIIVSESFDGSAFNLINTNVSSVQSFIYDIKMTVNGVETQPKGKITVRIPLPQGYNPNCSFIYHVNTTTGKVEKFNTVYVDGYLEFETTHFSYYAVVEEVNAVVTIRKPSTTTISYGDSIILHADIEGNVPAGTTVKWTASNDNFEIVEVSADGGTCKVTPKSSGTTTFTVSVVDANGKVLSTHVQDMTSKAGFFDKIIAFFKKLFGLTKTIPQIYKGIF